MDLDISQTLGIKGAKFDVNASIVYTLEKEVFGENWEKFLEDRNEKEKGVWRSLKLAREFVGEEVNGELLSKFWTNGRTLYSGRRRFYDDSRVLDDLDKIGVRSDITTLPCGFLKDELLRTQGHWHRKLLPEIYSVVFGRAGFLLFELGELTGEISNTRFVVAKEGEHVLFGPNDAHITINLNREPLVVTDLVSYNADPEFGRIERMNGGPFWVKYNGSNGLPTFEANPKYRNLDLKIVRPSAEMVFPNGFKLRRGESLFNVPRTKEGLRALSFLNEPWKHSYFKIYEEAFVPFG